MPFQSQAQRAWMYSNHPAMAKRWEAVTPKGQQLPNHTSPDSTSEETNRLGVRRLPRPPGAKRDFSPLTPSSKARVKLSKPSSEKEAMQETPVEAHFPDGRKEKMSLKAEHPPLRRRDIAVAAKSRVHK